MKLFVLGVSQWKMRDEKTGQVMSGTQLDAINADAMFNPIPSRTDDNGLVTCGERPLVYSVVDSVLHRLPPLPAMCECELGSIRGAKGKAQAAIVSIQALPDQFTGKGVAAHGKEVKG